MGKYKTSNMAPYTTGAGWGKSSPIIIVPPNGNISVGVKNDKGQYLSGSLSVEGVKWGIFEEFTTPRGTEGSRSTATWYKATISNSYNAPMCILAIPHSFYNQGGVAGTNYQNIIYTADMLQKGFDLQQKDIYAYYIVSTTNRVSGKGILDNKINIKSSTIINVTKGDAVSPSSNSADVVYNNSNISIPNIKKLPNALTQVNNNYTNYLNTKITSKDGVETTIAEHMTDTVINLVPYSTITIADIDAIINNTTLALFANDLTNIFFNGTINPANMQSLMIADSIESTLPIFRADVNGLGNMIAYFMGDEWTADNNDFLQESALKLNTDWTVYVKGMRRPNIYVTEISKALEDYISSDDNTTGLSLQDFSIQYRCPYWQSTPLMSTDKTLWTKTDVNVPLLPTKVYNDVLQTSYSNLISINYQGEWRDYVDDHSALDLTDPAQIPYAQLQFRLYLNDKIYSSWCEIGIGYIGSPTADDFTKMSNWGIVKGIDDGSTVTIIYDEYPDGYAPDDYIDPPNDTDKDITDGGTQGGETNNGLSLLTTSYAVTDDNLKELGNFLWTATIFDDIRLINNSPLDNIVSTKIMPIGLTGESVSLKIGNIDTEINAEKITNVPTIDVGSLKYKGYYNNFLDYAPYTQAYIFLPFIGFYEIDPVQCVGHTLNVKYVFDIVLGQCKAMIYIDNIYYMSYEGMCGVDIPLTGNNRAQLESAFLASAVTSVLTANPLPLVMTAINSQFQSHRSGSYSPSLGWAETRRCFVIFMIPNSQYPRTYGHDNGYPCNLSYSLGQLSGYTQTIPDPDISGIACTADEGNLIKQLLSSGVYL